jgi:hypothetical protein
MAFREATFLAAGPASERSRSGAEVVMAEALRLDIEPPSHGWATVRLSAPGVALEFTASYTPRDSISDLAWAAAGVLAGRPEQVVTWNTEPIEYEFRFATTGGRTRLAARQFPDSRRQRGCQGCVVAVVEGDPVTVARALWRGLRRLQGSVAAEEFATAWLHSFPAATVEQLGKQVRRQAAQQKPEQEAPADVGGFDASPC